MIRTPQSQGLHDSMVYDQAIYWRNQGVTVWADLQGWTKPGAINGHVADVLAQGLFTRVITEVETCDSLNSEHTRAQWIAFSSVRGAEFQVVVPKSCLGDAQRLAARWGVRVDKWWYRNNA